MAVDNDAGSLTDTAACPALQGSSENSITARARFLECFLGNQSRQHLYKSSEHLLQE